MTKFLFGQNK